jgi:prepilin-type N-terminal cleavage/methylation domain-containing protein
VKTTKTKRQDRGFTLIELMVVITIIAILASIATPAFTTMNRNAKITKDSSNVRQIILACKAFGGDFDVYPSWNPFEEADGEGGGGDDGGEFSSSTEAFNVLLQGGYIDQEAIFWYTMEGKNRPPVEDGKLEDKEVTYTYVSGQSDATYSRSPLVADQQESIGTYGENHPWLIARKAVVGYCGGQVIAERLDSDQPGAMVRTKQDNSEIFKRRNSGEESEGGGLLAVDEENVLQPGGGE